MKTKIKPESWVYVIVSKSKQKEELFGQKDCITDISFIPAFKNKYDAEHSLSFLSIKNKKNYEIQAIIYEDLIKYGSKNNFAVFIFNTNGKIEKYTFPKK
jgi:hypothetical protein